MCRDRGARNNTPRIVVIESVTPHAQVVNCIEQSGTEATNLIEPSVTEKNREGTW